MRILIFDDDAELCEELAELLRSEGYGVDTATDGFTAARLAFEKRHDLLLLDMEIPGVNRPELIKMLRRKNPLLRTCVITGSAFADKRLKKENISAFVDAVLLKPLPADLLLEKVGALTARPPSY